MFDEKVYNTTLTMERMYNGAGWKHQYVFHPDNHILILSHINLLDPREIFKLPKILR